MKTTRAKLGGPKSKTRKTKAPPPRIRPLAERRARDRKIMIEAIVDSAQELMRRDGAASINLQELARMVGIQAPSLYEYFDGKFDLYNELFDRGVQLFQNKIFAKLSSIGSFSEEVQAIFDAFIEFYQEHPELYRLVFEHPVPGFRPSAESIARTNAGFLRGMSQLKRALADECIDLPIPADHAVMLVEVAIFGIISRLLTNEPDVPFRKSRLQPLIPALVTLITSSSSRGAAEAPAVSSSSARKLRDA